MLEQVKKSLVLSIYFALAVSALLVFWQVRNFDFVNYDDNDYVSANPHVLNGLSAGAVAWAFTTNHAGNWHPLTWLSLMLDRQLFGPSPAGFHLTNLFFHIANILLLLLVLKQMTKAIWQSAFVAALFALHPMHVESVAWITERKDVLSTLFWLLAMLAYVRYCRCVAVPASIRDTLRRTAKRPSTAGVEAKHYYLVAVAFFALGLMTKPMLVTLPFILLLLDYWPLERKISRRLLVEKIPFFALSVISGILTFSIQQSGGGVTILSLNSRIANVFLSYVQYISKTFWPRNLAVLYPLPAAASIPFWQAAMCALLLLGISVFVVYLGRRNQRYLTVGWFWFIGTLLPVIGIVQVGFQAYADRYTYIPYIGLFIMLAWGSPQLLSKWISVSPQRKPILGLSMILVLATLGICTYRQVSCWQNSITLFSHALEVTQNNYVAYNNIGLAYSKLVRWPQAMEDYRQAIRINPTYAKAHYNLGFAYFSLGHSIEAIEAYKQAVKLKPDYTLAYNNIGVAYSGLGRYNEAIEAFKQAIKINPDSAELHTNLGSTYMAISDKKSAMAEYNILKSLNSELANKLLEQINK
jgi:tetratricopeptide (TPR) repeat protein